MKILAEKLKQYNLKVTPQRLAIFGMLNSTDKHPSAETIYRTLEPNHPSLSLATVYKTLDTLKKAKLIQEINVGEDSFRYDANNSPHAHIICVECKEVFDLPKLDIIDTIKNELVNKTDFIILNEQLFFYGMCKNCQQSNSSEEV